MNKTKKSFLGLVIVLTIIYFGAYAYLRLTKYFVGGSSVYYENPEFFYKVSETNLYKIGGMYVYHRAASPARRNFSKYRFGNGSFSTGRPAYIQWGIFYYNVILPDGYSKKDIICYYLFYPCTRTESLMRNVFQGRYIGDFMIIAVFVNLISGYSLMVYLRRRRDLTARLSS